jgi:hypothetical protein
MARKKKCCSDETEKNEKKTKRQRLDVALKKKEDKYYHRHVIKCTLGPFCKYAVIRKEIEDAVFWISRLQIHTHHLMTLYLSEKQGKLPNVTDASDLYGFWNTCYRHLANCLTKSPPRKGRNQELHELCLRYINGVGLECSWPAKCFGGWRSKLLEQMSKQSATIHKTHLDTNLYIYAIRYLRFLIDTREDCDDLRTLNKSQHAIVFSAICSAFERRIKVSEVIQKRPKTLEAFSKEHSIWKTAQMLTDILTSMVPEKCTVSAKSEIAFSILQQLEGYVQNIQVRFLAGEFKNSGRQRNVWLFSLCPQMEWRPKHIQISTTALKVLLKGLGKEYPFMKTISELPDDDIWKTCFQLHRVVRKCTFGNFISTDGVGVSCVTMKKKSPQMCRLIDISSKIYNAKKELKSQTQNEEELLEKIQVYTKEIQMLKKEMPTEKEKETQIPQEVKDMLSLVKEDDGTFVTDCKVIGIDPGKRNAATWVHHDPEKQRVHSQWKDKHSDPLSRFETGCLTGNQWRYESGQKQYTRKMNKRMDAIVPEWRSMKSTKTTNTETLLQVYRVQVSLWPKVEKAFFSEKWFAKMKMRKFCKRQKALESVVARITGTTNKEAQKKIVVAYGNGDNQGTLKGTSPMMSTALANKMKKSCTLVFVDEFRTSANCSCCHEEMKSKNYRVKWCCNTTCIRNLWNRDINAAINILLLFLQDCHDGTRSLRFSR